VFLPLPLRGCRRISVHLHPRRNVHRLRARLDEIDDTVQMGRAPGFPDA
jgi:hypothetical protein